MRNLSFLLGFLFLVPFVGYSQLANGSMAPDLTITDIDGVTHDLYDDYLDQGISVVLDLSAAWCPPCWTFHNNGVMEDIYDDYGPNSGDFLVMPMMIESDPGTNIDCFYGQSGCNDTSLGDYSGHPYPLCNPPSAEASAIANDFQIAFFPSIYIIAPSGYVQLSPLLANTTYSYLESWGAQSFQMENSTWSVTDNDCGPGSIDFQTFQGAGTVTYNWSNGATTEDISGLSTGDYSVTLTDSNGYTVEFGPIGVVGADPITIDNSTLTNIDCFGQSTGEISLSTTGGSGNFMYEWSTGNNDGPILSNLSADDYEVTITDTETDCDLIQDYELTQPEEVQVSLDIVNAGCGGVGGEITINATGGVAPYTYIINGTTYSQANINLPIGSYSVDILDTNTCTQTESFSITQLPLPTANSSVSGIIDCSELSVILSANGSSSGSNITYAWYSENGDFVSSNSEYETSMEGIYTLYVIDNNTNCETSSEVTVVNNAIIPTALITPLGSLTCNSSTITLSSVGSSTGPNISYKWSDDNGGNIVGSNTGETVTIDAAGDYSLLVEDDSNSCENEIQITITEATAPNLTITGSNTFCQGETGLLCVDITTAQSIEWLLNGHVIGTNNCLEINNSASYTAILTDTTTGCSSQQEVTTVSNSLPSALVLGDLSFCVGGSTVLCHQSETDVTYNWLVNGQPNVAASCITINQSSQVQLQASNSLTGCTAYQNVTVSTQDLPTAQLLSLDGTETNCDTETVTLDLVTQQNNLVTWSDSAGNIIANTEDISVPAGTYNYSILSAFGCQLQGSVVVTEDNEVPELSIAEPTILTCNTPTATLAFSTTSTTFTLEWLDANGNSLAGQNPIVSTPGLYIAQLTDENGCRVQASVNVSENMQSPNIGVIFSDPMEFDCNTSSIDLEASSVLAGETFSWNDEQGLELGTDSSLTITEPGTYTLIVTGTNGCTAESTLMIQANSELPQINILTPLLLDCNNSTVTLELDGDLDGNTILWSDESGMSLGTTASISATNVGTYTATVSTPGGCSTMTTTTVRESETELVHAAFTSEVNLNEVNLSSTTIVSGNVTYHWDLGDGTTASTPNLTYQYQNPGQYEVCLTISNECGTTVDCQTIMTTAAISFNATVQDISCPGGTDGRIIVNVTGGTPMYTYVWSDPNITGMGSAGLSAGDYQVVITDANGLDLTIDFTLTEPEPIISEATITPTSMVDANGQISLSITGGTAPYEVMWDDGSQGLERAGLGQGTYMAVITDDNNCQIVSTFTITGSTAITEISSLSKFILSPNPASNEVTIEATFSESLKLVMSLINARGEKLFNNKVETDLISRKLDLSNYPSGIYLLELRSGQQVSYKKLIITK